MKVVISQPMFFPWVGLLEQIRLADVYVDYNDVQFSKGSFVNRVQIKTSKGQRWLTIPLQNMKFGQVISEVEISYDDNWHEWHLEVLKKAYEEAPFCADMLRLVLDVYRQRHTKLGSLAHASLMVICKYFGLADQRRFIDVVSLKGVVPGKGSKRVLDLVTHLGGNVYITGHGARNYLEHEAFEKAGIRVEYIHYKKLRYPQLHGEFVPYVSALDLIANVGRAGIKYICSESVYWKDFLRTLPQSTDAS